MNKFAALDDDTDDEQETNPKPVAVKEKAVKAKKAAAEAPVVAAPAPAPAPVANGKPKEKESNSEKKTENKKAHEKKPVATAVAETDDTQPSKENNRGGRGRGGKSDNHGGRGSRPPRPTAEGEAGQEAPRRPRREFDRRSSTGRGRGELHRGGRGPYGAGNVKQEALDAERNPALAEPEIEPVDLPTPAAESAEEEAGEPAEGEAAPTGWTADPEPEPQPEAEPEPPTFTLDEYNERQKEARARVLAKVEARPERTVDLNAPAYSGLTVKAKEDLGDDVAGKAKKEKEAKAKQEQQLLDVGFKFQAPATYPDRGDRPERGRGGGRGDRPFSGRGGGGGGGGGRGSRGPTSVFKMETDFPKLG